MEIWRWWWPAGVRSSVPAAAVVGLSKGRLFDGGIMVETEFFWWVLWVVAAISPEMEVDGWWFGLVCGGS